MPFSVVGSDRLSFSDKALPFSTHGHSIGLFGKIFRSTPSLEEVNKFFLDFFSNAVRGGG